MVQYLSREICLCQSLQSAQFCPESARGSQGHCLASQHPPGARSLALQGFAQQTEAAGSPLARRGTLPPFPGCGHAQHLLHPPPEDQSHFLDVSKQHMLTDSWNQRQMRCTTALHARMALETRHACFGNLQQCLRLALVFTRCSQSCVQACCYISEID